MIDERILVRFQGEFAASKDRLVRARERVNELTADLAAAQRVVEEELGVQSAINGALNALGQESLS